jgi:hypothetical protein
MRIVRISYIVTITLTVLWANIYHKNPVAFTTCGFPPNLSPSRFLQSGQLPVDGCVGVRRARHCGVWASRDDDLAATAILLVVTANKGKRRTMSTDNGGSAGYAAVEQHRGRWLSSMILRERPGWVRWTWCVTGKTVRDQVGIHELAKWRSPNRRGGSGTPGRRQQWHSRFDNVGVDHVRGVDYRERGRMREN